MRVVVTGATGNVGTSVLQSLSEAPEVSEVIGIARRLPELTLHKCRFVSLDITSGDLVGVLSRAHAVIHLAWLVQPNRDEKSLEAVNVAGSRRVFEAVVRAGTPHLIVASSVGAYAKGPKDRRVDETWPTTGVPTSLYSRQKAAVERALDELEAENPELAVTRMRPALIFKHAAGAEIRRFFVGHCLPRWFLDVRALRFVPRTSGLRFQAVHSLDVGDAFRAAVVRQARGAFNLAADPVLDTDKLVTALDARSVRVPARVLRAGAALTYHLRLQPTDPGWVDLALNTPLVSVERAVRELGWTPRFSAMQAVKELFDGIREDAGIATGPLMPESSH